MKHVSVVGKVAKTSDFSEKKTIAACSGADVGWSFVQIRVAGSACWGSKHQGRRACGLPQPLCCWLQKSKGLGGWQYKRAVISRYTTAKKSPFVYTYCLMKEVVDQVCSNIVYFLAG